MSTPRKGATYRYEPVLIDALENDHIAPGTIVRVVSPPGIRGRMPRQFRYVETLDGRFLGMVASNSLQSKSECKRCGEHARLHEGYCNHCA